MIRMASCRRGRVHFGRRFAPLRRLLRLMWCGGWLCGGWLCGGWLCGEWLWLWCGVLRNRIMECTYSWLRPIRPLLGRCTEISRTLDSYVCFFGRGRTFPLRRRWCWWCWWCWLSRWMSLMIRPEYCCRRVCMDVKSISIFLILQYQCDIIKIYSI
jgi:hypothetical protein